MIGLHHYRLRDCQGKRQTHHKARAFVALGSNINMPAQHDNFAAHHIHPHAAPGNLRHLARGRQPAGKDQLHDLVLVYHFTRL